MQKTWIIRNASPTDNRVIVNLRDFLDLIKPFGEGLDWVVFDLSGVGQLSYLPILDLEKKTRARAGYRFSWHALEQFSDEIIQVINGIFVAFRELPDASDEVFSSRNRVFESGEFALECCDSSYWLLRTNDLELLDSFRSRFGDLKTYGID